MTYVLQLKVSFSVDIFPVYDTLFSVMSDNPTCEEVFEAPMAPEPELAEGVDLGRLFDRMRGLRDWAGSEFAEEVYRPNHGFLRKDKPYGPKKP